MSSCAPTWESACEWNCCFRPKSSSRVLPRRLWPGEEVAPGLFGELAAFHGLAGDVVAPHRGDDHDVFPAHRGGEFGDLAGRLPGGFPLVQAAVEGGEHGAGRDLQVAGLELLGEPGGVGGEVAVGAEFDPLVAGFGDLVEEAFPRGLLGVIRRTRRPRSPARCR